MRGQIKSSSRNLVYIPSNIIGVISFIAPLQTLNFSNLDAAQYPYATNSKNQTIAGSEKFSTPLIAFMK